MPCGKLGLRGPIIIQFMQHRIITVEQAGIGDSMKMKFVGFKNKEAVYTSAFCFVFFFCTDRRLVR